MVRQESTRHSGGCFLLYMFHVKHKCASQGGTLTKGPGRNSNQYRQGLSAFSKIISKKVSKFFCPLRSKLIGTLGITSLRSLMASLITAGRPAAPPNPPSIPSRKIHAATMYVQLGGALWASNGGPLSAPRKRGPATCPAYARLRLLFIRPVQSLRSLMPRFAGVPPCTLLIICQVFFLESKNFLPK